MFKLNHLAVFISLLILSLAATAAPSSQDFTITTRNNMRFSQKHLTVAPGEKVTIKLVNKSHLPPSAMSHNWVLLKQSTNVDAFASAAQNARSDHYIPQSMKSDIIAHTKMLGGGESDTITFTAPEKPGDYEYICTFPGHYRAGMKGVLTVSKPGDSD